MLHYKNILVAVDLSPFSNKILEKAKEIAAKSNAKINLVHVMEHSPLSFSGEFSIPMDPNFEQQLESQVLEALSSLGEKFDIPTENLYLKQGSVGHVVSDLATAIDADLLIVGTHGHRGLEILLGSRANAILHQSFCDVLSVRMPKQ